MISVVKIGGNIIDDAEALSSFLTDFAALPGKKILVHGGGKEATRISAKLGIETTMINGRRVTTRETLDVVTMVYAGLLNKRIVSMLQALGCNAIGLSGADGNVIKATRRNPEPVDFGFVGDVNVDSANSLLIKTLTDDGFVPVVCAITHDGNGQLLNCNADTVAQAMAVGASKVDDTQLIYCFEQPGVMVDINDADSIIPMIDKQLFAELKQNGIVNKGMLPKLENAFTAIECGVKSVIIKHAKNLNNDIATVIHG